MEPCGTFNCKSMRYHTLAAPYLDHRATLSGGSFSSRSKGLPNLHWITTRITTRPARMYFSFFSYEVLGIRDASHHHGAPLDRASRAWLGVFH